MDVQAQQCVQRTITNQSFGLTAFSFMNPEKGAMKENH